MLTLILKMLTLESLSTFTYDTLKMTGVCLVGGAIGFVSGSAIYILRTSDIQGKKDENGTRKFIVDPKYARTGYNIGGLIALVYAVYNM
jgi:hypothetical protein